MGRFSIRTIWRLAYIHVVVWIAHVVNIVTPLCGIMCAGVNIVNETLKKKRQKKFGARRTRHEPRRGLLLSDFEAITNNLKFLYFFSFNSKLRQPTQVLYAFTVLYQRG